MSQVRFADSHEEIPRAKTNDVPVDVPGRRPGKATATASALRSPSPGPEQASTTAATATTPPATPSSFSHSSPNDGDDNGSGEEVRTTPGGTAPPHPVKRSSSSLHSKVIRENLMRVFKNRDPLFYYEVVSVLGVGSMGSVAKVHKKDSVVGGSARRGLQKHFERERKLKVCFSLPFVGGFFRACLDKTGDGDTRSVAGDSSNRTPTDDGSSLVSNPRASTRSRNSSILNTKNAAFEVMGPTLSIDGQEQSEASGSMLYEQHYAMKSIHLSRVTDPSFVEELKNEIQILRNLDHPHIVRPIETFDYRNQLFIVMELCTGGDLYTRDPYTEEEAARITSSILSAVAFMHAKGITHRDLKYENILFVDNSPRAEIKLIDFGLSKVFFGGSGELTDGVGTIYTMSPEVLKGSYTQEADVWSIGVIAYMLLSSQMPFYGRKRSAIIEQILEGRYEFRGRRWKKVSAQAKDFVQSLLVVDPAERATADEAYSMSWLNKRYAATVRCATEEEIDKAKDSLFRFSKYSRLKKVALMVIAHKSTSAEIGILRKIFQQYDTKKDGSLSYEEFKAAYAQAGMSEDDCAELFDAIDLDGSGRIRYTEFLAATIEARGTISEERLAEAFDRIDSDDSGYISTANLREILGDDFPEEEIQAIIEEADLSHDGQISYSEFLALWEDKNEALQEQADGGSRDSGSSGTGTTVDIVARANFIEGKQTAARRRMSIAESAGDDMAIFLQEQPAAVPSVIFDSSQVNVSERFGDATDILLEEKPRRRISAAV